VIIYADSSALLKLLLQEEGTPAMAAVAAESEVIATAAIAYVELRATVAAAIRGRRVRRGVRDRLVTALERLWAQVSEIALDTPLLRQAGDLAERMGLRGYDAVHLAALQELGSPADVTFACWDTDLRRAARDLGYTLVPA
jgi:predicted nucleic acid-binding protein